MLILDLFQIVNGKELAVMVNVDRIAFVQEADLPDGTPAARIFFSASKDDFILVTPGFSEVAALMREREVDPG